MGSGWRRVSACVVFVLIAALTACTGSDEPKTATPAVVPAGDAFWDGPADLNGTEAGELIWSRPYDGAFALAGADNHLVLYAQEGIAGEVVATSGLVAIPPGTAPADGWPVISWAHGTIGIADDCAPSRLAQTDPTYPGNQLLQSWLDAGFAVVSTDYEGLGTQGDHPYLIGASAGRSVLDIVRAARELDTNIGDRVLLAGHSQGGHAALWAASLAPRHDRTLDVVGTLAYAPPSNLAMILEAVLRGEVAAPPAIIAMVLRGLDIAYPDRIDAEAVLTPEALALYPRTLDTCLAGLAAPELFGSMGSENFGDPAADLQAIIDTLNANDPSFPEIRSRILIVQGGLDQVVPPILTDFLVETYEKRDLDVELDFHPKGTHSDILSRSSDTVEEFVTEAFAAQ